MFTYIPICNQVWQNYLIVGSQDLKCLCKHSCTEHHPNTKKCQRAGCKNCSGGFNSKHGCSCPYLFGDHVTVFESREEREAAGRPVDPKWMQESNVSMNFQANLCSLKTVNDLYYISYLEIIGSS